MAKTKCIDRLSGERRPQSWSKYTTNETHLGMEGMIRKYEKTFRFRLD